MNLVDYYFVNRGQYDVAALSDPDGRYGRWNLPGILVYAFGVLVQMPFISTKLYTGPMVERLGGVDISWIDRFEQESLTFFEAVRAAYWRRAEQYPGIFRVIDASQSIENVQLQIDACFIEIWERLNVE